MKVSWENMSWPEIEETLKQPNAVVLPVGSLEQHGPHLPVNVDFRCATYIAEQAANKVIEEHQIPVLVLPPMYYTETSSFCKFPGTVGVSPDTTAKVIEEIVRNLVVHQGVKNILIVNGHHANAAPIAVALRRVHADSPEAGLYAVDWWALGSEVTKSVRKSEIGGMWHACELETSASLIIQPENVHLEKAVKEIHPYQLSGKWEAPDFYGPHKLLYHSRKWYPRIGRDPGIMGDATVASEETGRQIIGAVVDDLAELIVEIVRSEGRSL